MIPNFIVMLHHHVGADEKQRVMIRIYYQRLGVYIKTEIMINKAHFNSGGQVISKRSGKTIVTENVWVKTSHPEHSTYNAIILSYLEKATAAWKELQTKKLPISAAAIKEKMDEVPQVGSIVQFVNLELQHKRKLGQFSSSDHYRGYFEKLFKFYKRKIIWDKEKEIFIGDDLYFEEITSQKIKEFRAELSETITVRKKPLGQYSITKYLASIRSLLIKNPNYDDYIKKQFKGIEFVRSNQTKVKLPIEIFEQFAKEEIDESKREFDSRNIFIFCYYCQGIRIGEALTATFSKYANARLLVKVEKTWNEDKFRDILLNKKAIEIIEYYAARRGESDYIFPFMKVIEDGSNHRYFKKQIEAKTAQINKNIKSIAKRLGIKENVSTHVARHSFIDRAVRMTGDIYGVSKGVGHGTVSVTEVYAEGNQIKMDELDKVYETLVTQT